MPRVTLQERDWKGVVSIFLFFFFITNRLAKYKVQKKKIWNDWTTESFCFSVKRDLSARLNHKEAPFVVYFASIYLTLSYQCMFMFTLINWNKRYDRLSPLIDIPLLRWTKIIKAINFIIRYCTYCFYQSYPPKFRTITQALPHASPQQRTLCRKI